MERDKNVLGEICWLNDEKLNMVLYAIAKMIDIDGRENKEKWKKLFLELSNK